MPFDEKTAERVRRRLKARGHEAVERTLMGTLAFVVDGGMCCCVSGEGLLVRVDAEGREAALARPHVTVAKLRGRVMKAFVLVDAQGIATARALDTWIERGLGLRESARGRRRRTVRAR